MKTQPTVLDEVRKLSAILFEAGQREKRLQPPEIWGTGRDLKFKDLPSESVVVWDAVALAALQYWSEKRQHRRNAVAAALLESNPMAEFHRDE